MRPLYGGGIRSMLFDTTSDIELADAANTAMQACNQYVTYAIVTGVSVAPFLDSTVAGGLASGVTVDIRYRLPPLEQTFELRAPVLFMTEEAPL